MRLAASSVYYKDAENNICNMHNTIRQIQLYPAQTRQFSTNTLCKLTNDGMGAANPTRKNRRLMQTYIGMHLRLSAVYFIDF